MLIEGLIRLGRVLRAAESDPAETIRQVTDVMQPRAGEFLQRVYLVEVDDQHEQVCAHPSRSWAVPVQRGRQRSWQPDGTLATVTPITFSAGNPKAAQGSYPVPAYIVFADQWSEMKGSPEATLRFLRPRWARTRQVPAFREALGQVAVAVAEAFARENASEVSRALILVTPVAPGNAYEYGTGADGTRTVDLGESLLRPGQRILAQLDRILDLIWMAKSHEAAEFGQLSDGTCSICRGQGPVVSIYSKAWTWFTTTWPAPLPQELNEHELVEGVALCPSCYASLTYGAQAFSRLRKPLPNWIVKELFSPVDSPTGAQYANRRPDPIYACAIPLPVLDGFLDNRDERELFVSGIARMSNAEGAPGVVRHLQTVTGFDLILTEALASDIYRLTLYYYQGREDRGEVYLRAVIEDVLPSVVSRIDDILRRVSAQVLDELSPWRRQATAARQNFDMERYSSLPYLLVTAYGPSHLWQALEATLHRRVLSYEVFVRNAARRLSELAHNLEENFFSMQSEIQFDLVFQAFYQEYMRDIVGQEAWIGMRPWQELQEMLGELEPAAMRFTDVAELGFAVGHVTRTFSRWYYNRTKVGTKGKDFLRHRVMTFGSSLTPDSIIREGLARFEEYALKLDMGLPSRFRQVCGVLLDNCLRQKAEINRNRDSFMQAFWAGYQLQDLDPRRGATAEEEATEAS